MFNSLLHSIDLKKLCENVGEINKVYFYFVPMCHSYFNLAFSSHLMPLSWSSVHFYLTQLSIKQ